MNYAIVEDGIVTNLIVLNPNDARDFPDAVCCEGKPVRIGDTYQNEEFYNIKGEKIITYEQIALIALNKANLTIVELDAALLEATYQSIIGGIE